MSSKRKQKLQERKARLQELRQRHHSAEFLSKEEVSIQREVDYVVRCATHRDTRCVTLGAFTFFSTELGDAWMLDAEDGLALCLARDGVPQAVRILETDSNVSVQWEHTYTMEGESFTTTDMKTSRTVTVVGYPIQVILTAIQDAKDAQL